MPVTRKVRLVLALAAAFALLPLLLLAAATYSGDHVFSGGRVSFGTGGILQPPQGTSLPGTCAVGDVFFDNDATAGQNFYACTATNTWTLQGGGGSFSPIADTSIAYLIDEFPCKNPEDGEVGFLGWQYINTWAGSSCTGGGGGTPTGQQSIVPSAGNTPSGFALARQSGTTVGVIQNTGTVAWEMQARVQISADLAEVVYKIGLGDDVASESVNHAAAGQDFIGIVYKNETTDTSNECFGTTGSSANWQAQTVKDGTSAGLQNTTLAAVTTTYLWFRARQTATNTVEICVDSTNSAPTWPSGQCYTETSSANLPTNGMSPFFVVSSCDGSSISGNSNRMDVDYFHLKVPRY